VDYCLIKRRRIYSVSSRSRSGLGSEWCESNLQIAIPDGKNRIWILFPAVSCSLHLISMRIRGRFLMTDGMLTRQYTELPLPPAYPSVSALASVLACGAGGWRAAMCHLSWPELLLLPFFYVCIMSCCLLDVQIVKMDGVRPFDSFHARFRTLAWHRYPNTPSNFTIQKEDSPSH
jgi:hypothetical protein